MAVELRADGEGAAGLAGAAVHDRVGDQLGQAYQGVICSLVTIEDAGQQPAGAADLVSSGWEPLVSDAWLRGEAEVLLAGWWCHWPFCG
jgi:hypothetical protein